MTDEAPVVVVIDWDDPCDRAKALSNAYYSLLSGGNAQRVRSRGGESETDVTYSATNLNALRSEMIAAQEACAVKNGAANPRRRFAITAGSMWPGRMIIR